jgi:DNA-binding PadR family transcriptional regulator
MENVVLGLLIIQSLTLYELNQAFKQGISMFYSASYGSLQAAVKNLLQKEMVVFEEKVDRGRNKKVYSITENGRAAFYTWMLADTPVSKLEVTALSKIYFLGLIPEVPQKKQIVIEIMRQTQAVQDELVEMNEAIRQMNIPDTYQEILHFQLKTLEYGIKSHAFAREWFQALLDNLV